jgi:hypothetical protein
MPQEICGPNFPTPRTVYGHDNSRSSAQGLDLSGEGLKLVAALQVKIDVLRRAQAMGPQLADELQIEIAEIERHLRAFGQDRAGALS